MLYDINRPFKIQIIYLVGTYFVNRMFPFWNQNDVTFTAVVLLFQFENQMI